MWGSTSRNGFDRSQPEPAGTSQLVPDAASAAPILLPSVAGEDDQDYEVASPLYTSCLAALARSCRRLCLCDPPDHREDGRWALDYQDGAQSLVRVLLLAADAWGVAGCPSGREARPSVSMASHSLLRQPLFVGFSLEVVFSMIEAMVAGVADKMRTQVLLVAPGAVLRRAATYSVASPVGSTTAQPRSWLIR